MAEATFFFKFAELDHMGIINNFSSTLNMEEIPDFPKSVVICNKRKIIVTFLPQYFTTEHFHRLVSGIGNLLSYKLVQRTECGKQINLGYGFADYETEEDAAKAIETLNGLKIQNKVLKVSYARMNNPWIKGSNLYVKGIPRTMNESEIEDLFGHFGTVISVRVLYVHLDSATMVSKGVAFVRFNTRTEACIAMSQLNGVQLRGADDRLEIREATCKYSAPFRKYVLYVVNFPPTWSWSELSSLFGSYTLVDDVKVFNKGKRVYGLVFVLGYQNAMNAISALNGRMIFGKKLEVSFKSTKTV